MTVVHATGFGLNAFRNYILGKVGQLFIYDLRNSVYQKLQRQSLSFFHDRAVVSGTSAMLSRYSETETFPDT